MSLCERAGAPVIRVTVFTFPLRCTGAQEAHRDEGVSTLCCIFMQTCVYVCFAVALDRICVLPWGGSWEGVLRIIALQSFSDHPNGALMSLGGLWMLPVPTEWKGHVTFFIFFSQSFLHLPPAH